MTQGRMMSRDWPTDGMYIMVLEQRPNHCITYHRGGNFEGLKFECRQPAITC